MKTDWMAMGPRLHMCFSDDLWSCLLWEFCPFIFFLDWSYRPSHFIWWAVITHRPFPFPRLLYPFHLLVVFAHYCDSFFSFSRQIAKAFSFFKVDSRSCAAWVSGGITFHYHSPSLNTSLFSLSLLLTFNYSPLGSFYCCFVLKSNLDSQV